MSVLPIGFGSSGSSAIDTGDIPASLRCRSSASAYLSKTITTDATSTYFAAVKRGKLGVISPIFDTNIKFNANDTLTAFGLTTTAVFRDPTSWLFIHVSNGGLYVNGVSYGAVTTSALTNPRLGYDGTNYFDGYIARIGCVAGSSSAYTNFGQLNTTINEWVSKSQSAVKAVVDAGGTNSFMLDFDDATSLTTLGYDKSTKGNNWTLNNFSLTAGTTYDHMLDVPGNSYATLNPIYPSAASITNGNLTSATTAVRATQNALLYDCKWEVTAGASAVTAGVISATGTTNTTSVTANKTFAFRLTTAGALDYKNVTDAGSWTSITTGLTGEQYPYGITQAANWNFGQAPLHASATYQSAAGGYFYDTTAGFKALCQANLEEPAILNPEDHHVDIAVTKSGDTNFTLPWDADTYDTFFEIKRRDAAGDWYQIDGLRGYTKILKSNSTAAETTDANVLGVSGTTCTLKSTLADGTYIVSATKAGLAAARQTNTDGSITSTVSRNVDSGFAIVLSVGTGVAGTIGHGLGAVVKHIIGKNRSTAIDWPAGHYGAGWSTAGLYNGTNSFGASAYWNSGGPTTTVFSVGASNNTNQNASNHVFYCYADSAIQKSFSYTGNGSADGPYVNLGFKCGRFMLKGAGNASNWNLFDSVRSPENLVDDLIRVNLSDAENISGGTTIHLDFVAQAAKVRGSSVDINGSSVLYIGHAWAAVTGRYSLAR